MDRNFNIPSHPAEWMYLLNQYIRGKPTFTALHKHFEDVGLDWQDMAAQHEKFRSDCVLTYNNNLPNLLLAAIAGFQRDVFGLKTIIPDTLDDDFRNQVRFLEDQGYCELSPIAPDLVSEIVSFLEGENLVTGTDPRGLERVPVNAAKHTHNVALYPIDTVLDCPHVLELANNPDILAVVEKYLGATPTLLFPAIWWSFAQKESAEEAQFFHFDFDDHRFCKMFIYLTDVDLESGPHVYIENSHQLKTIKKCRATGPHTTSEFDDWYFRVFRKSDSDVKKYLNLPERSFVGSAGTRFIADTSGIHKGQLPTKNDRLLCQFTYGVSPQALVPYEPKMIPITDTNSTPPKLITEQPYSYVNRLFFTTTGAP
jgi:hypothetical protein